MTLQHGDYVATVGLVLGCGTHQNLNSKSAQIISGVAASLEEQHAAKQSAASRACITPWASMLLVASKLGQTMHGCRSETACKRRKAAATVQGLNLRVPSESGTCLCMQMRASGALCPGSCRAAVLRPRVHHKILSLSLTPAGKRRKTAITVQGQFLQTLSLDDLVTGQEFPRAAQNLPAKWLLETVLLQVICGCRQCPHVVARSICRHTVTFNCLTC